MILMKSQSDKISNIVKTNEGGVSNSRNLSQKSNVKAFLSQYLQQNRTQHLDVLLIFPTCNLEQEIVKSSAQIFKCIKIEERHFILNSIVTLDMINI